MIVVIYGTRPEAIKCGPVVAELKALRVPHRVVCTGQHRELLRGTPAETDLADSVSLAVPSTGNILRWLETVEHPLKTLLGTFAKESVVVVQGDTMSALAGARAADSLWLRLAHVEAGIRSHNPREPWPEEEFRVEIDALADWHYAPTTTSYVNLLSECVPANTIRVTGNTVVSALARYTEPKARQEYAGILVTLHRREWLHGRHFLETCEALGDVGREQNVPLTWPVHPGVRARLNGFRPGRMLELVSPLGYESTIALLGRSLGVVTDSGGLQEEAATLGVPCAVLRNVTDRPESIEAGVARLFSPTAIGAREAVTALCEGRIARIPTSVYGHPDAAHEIAKHLGTLIGAWTPYCGD